MEEAEGNNFYEEDDYENFEYNSYDDSCFSCEVCDEEFSLAEDYQFHLSRHKKCTIEGCAFEASFEMIEYHIKTQHLTGLFEKFCKVQTPEDITKWRDERRVQFPTIEKIQMNREKKEEMFKRGEKIGERKNRFGKDKTRREYCTLFSIHYCSNDSSSHDGVFYVNRLLAAYQLPFSQTICPRKCNDFLNCFFLFF